MDEFILKITNRNQETHEMYWFCFIIKNNTDCLVYKTDLQSYNKYYCSSVQKYGTNLMNSDRG